MFSLRHSTKLRRLFSLTGPELRPDIAILIYSTRQNEQFLNKGLIYKLKIIVNYEGAS
jgi:hypothetical protein